MFCRKCGAKLLDDSQFCPKCGTKVEESKAPEREAPSPSDETEKKEAPPKDRDPLLLSPDAVAADDSLSTSAPPQSSARSSTPEASPSISKSSDEPGESPEKKEEAPAPPPVLPTPDGFAKANEQEKREREKAVRAKERRKKKERGHPLDAYQPLRGRLRLGGCALLILLVVVLPLLVLGGLGWMQYNQFVNEEGFASIQQMDSNVLEAPDEATLYWHWDLWKGVLYEAETTEAEIAIVGGTWWLEGTFKEKVSFRGYRLILEKDAVFEKGLDVNAVRFDPGTSEIEGKLTGNIMFQD